LDYPHADYADWSAVVKKAVLTLLLALVLAPSLSACTSEPGEP
jgi:hypothetical protein